MENSINSNEIIKRIQSGEINNSDLESLRELLHNNDNETLQQLGKFNVSIDDGKKIHIGDRNYFNWSDEAIQAVVEVVQQGKAVAVFNPTGKVTIYNYYNYYREETITVPDEATEETDNLPCPYRGLFTFGLEDAEYFFGRDVFIEELYQATQTKRFIPVLGASGSGKSSVIFAGLVPRLLTEENWLFTHFRPGTDPFYSLAQALIPLYAPDLNPTQLIIQADELSNYLKDTKKTNQLLKVFEQIQHNHPQNRTLLIADQFEELYTLCSDEQTRRKFLDILLNTFQFFNEQSSLSTVLVATMRVDFLGNVLAYPPLADILRNGDVKIRSMNEKELREIIEKPAQKLGVNFEAGLVESIFKDIDKEPGNLPLLEFALTELWQKRQGQQLTHKAYKEIGQVSGALTRYADEKYRQLKPKEQQQVHRIFVQLVRPGEGTEDTRRVATKAELNENNWNLVKKLADARLVVTNRRVVTREQENSSEQQQKTEQETVEVVHEALIRNWGKLKGWMQEDREFRAWQERMRGTMLHWRKMSQDEGLLLRGAALIQAEEKLKERQEELSEGEQEFIRLSQEQQEKEQKQKQRQRQQIFGGLVAFSVIVSFLAIRAVIGEKNAQMQAELTTLASRFASDKSLDTLIEGIRLGKNLNNGSWWVETDNLIRGTVLLQQMVYGVKEYNRLEGHKDGVFTVAFSPTENLIVSGGRLGEVKLWKPDGTMIDTLKEDGGMIRSIAFSPDGNLIAAGNSAPGFLLWKKIGNQFEASQPWEKASTFNIAVFSPNENLIALSGWKGKVELWDTKEGNLKQPLNVGNSEVESVAFSPNGELIASADREHIVRLWRTNDGKLVCSQPIKGYNVAFTPNGQLMTDSKEGVKFWNPQNCKLIHFLQDKIFSFSLSSGVAFRSTDKLIASGDGKTVLLWKPDGRLVDTLIGHNDDIWSVAFSYKGDLIASASLDGTVKLWKPDGNAVTTLEGFRVAFNPQSNLIASITFEDTIKLWKSDGNLDGNLKDAGRNIRDLAFSPDGKLIASISEEGIIKIWNTEDRTELALREDCPVNTSAAKDDAATAHSAGEDGLTRPVDGRHCPRNQEPAQLRQQFL
ncbi:MAG: WD40 repeat domain-containing protein, partial [Okeania sp. SIO1H6]|nr:WD40 repeat domain-containing protein [Okeania sp. SIO1H6]